MHAKTGNRKEYLKTAFDLHALLRGERLNVQQKEPDVAEVSESGTYSGAALPAAGGFDDSQPVRTSKWYRWRRSGAAVLDYLLDAEVHTYAFSVAANAIIS